MGRPRTGSTGLMVKTPPGLINAVDRWISLQPDASGISRPEALRRLAAESLKRAGLLDGDGSEPK